MIQKRALALLLLSFIIVVLTAIGMQTPYRHWFKQIHEIVGFVFVLLACFHVYSHKNGLRMLFFRKKTDDNSFNPKA